MRQVPGLRWRGGQCHGHVILRSWVCVQVVSGKASGVSSIHDATVLLGRQHMGAVRKALLTPTGTATPPPETKRTLSVCPSIGCGELRGQSAWSSKQGEVYDHGDLLTFQCSFSCLLLCFFPWRIKQKCSRLK